MMSFILTSFAHLTGLACCIEIIGWTVIIVDPIFELGEGMDVNVCT